MPNIKSSIRSVKTDAELNAKNSAVKSSIRKAVRKLNEAIEAGQTEEAKNLQTNAVSGFDKAVQKSSTRTIASSIPALSSFNIPQLERQSVQSTSIIANIFFILKPPRED